MSTNDGGPAFPQPCTEGGYSANSPYGIAGGGLSMRDYFAAKALQGLMANKSNPLHFNPEDDAAYVYRIADAMLKAREAA